MFIQTSSAESLTGRLTRLAAECQRFLMSALLNLLCPGFIINYIVLQLTFGKKTVCYHESARWRAYFFGPFQIRKDTPGSPMRRDPQPGIVGFKFSVERLFYQMVQRTSLQLDQH